MPCDGSFSTRPLGVRWTKSGSAGRFGGSTCFARAASQLTAANSGSCIAASAVARFSGSLCRSAASVSRSGAAFAPCAASTCSQAGSPRRMASKSKRGCARDPKGLCVVETSKRRQPSAQQSQALPLASCARVRCSSSGAMYSSVPTIDPGDSFVTRNSESPKSESEMCPSASTRTFCGLTSRCTMPSLCRCANARTSSAA
mmetsp:Transcript_6438/g.20647  ORF Transcript_6438/g.20647 Transcript_6438/m.20647 type:complete len:201 (+) Transcript_6438:286-888(+)